MISIVRRANVTAMTLLAVLGATTIVAQVPSTEVDLRVPAGAVTLELRRDVSIEPANGLLGSHWRLMLAGIGDPIPLDGSRVVPTKTPQYTDVLDARKRLASRTDRGGHAVAITYDARGRVARIAAPAGVTITFATDATGHLTSVRAPNTEVTYQYSGNDLASVQRPGERTVRYTYVVEEPRSEARAPVVTSGAARSVGQPGQVRLTAANYRTEADAALNRINTRIFGQRATELGGIAKSALEAQAAALENLRAALKLGAEIEALLLEIEGVAADPAMDVSAQCSAAEAQQRRLATLKAGAELRQPKVDTFLEQATTVAAACSTAADAAKIIEHYNNAAATDRELSTLLQEGNDAFNKFKALEAHVAAQSSSLRAAYMKLMARVPDMGKPSALLTQAGRFAARAADRHEEFELVRVQIGKDISSGKTRFAVPPPELAAERVHLDIAAEFDTAQRQLASVSVPRMPGEFDDSLNAPERTAAQQYNANALALQDRLLLLACTESLLTEGAARGLQTELRQAVNSAHASLRGSGTLPAQAAACAASAGGITTDGSTPRTLRLVIEPRKSTISVGESVQFRAAGRWSDGSGEPADFANVQWSSRGPVFTAAREDAGQTFTITATGADGLTDSATVTVAAVGEVAESADSRTLSGFVISPENPRIKVGDRVKFTARGVWSDGNGQLVEIPDVVFKGQILPDFKATAADAGKSFTITARGPNGVTSTTTLTVDSTSDPPAPGTRPCNPEEQAMWAKIVGTWAASYGPVTFTGSCENVSGSWQQGDVPNPGAELTQRGVIKNGRATATGVTFEYAQDWNKKYGTDICELRGNVLACPYMWELKR